MRLATCGYVLFLAGVLAATPWQFRSHASEAPELSIELNDLSKVGGACRVTFLMKNALGEQVTDLRFELVLFGKDQRIIRLIAVTAGQLPVGKSRVRQFDLKGIECGDVGRALLNDITQCAGDQLTPATCLAAAKLSSRIDVPFIL
ncbi:MAG: Tat pathway signal protein [Pseudomonadota bacterium]